MAWTSIFCAGVAAAVETVTGALVGVETFTVTTFGVGLADSRTAGRVSSSFWGQKRIRRIAITRRMMVKVGQCDLTKFHEEEKIFAVCAVGACEVFPATWVMVGVVGVVAAGVEAAGVEGVEAAIGAGVGCADTATGFPALCEPLCEGAGTFDAMLLAPPVAISELIDANVFVIPPNTAAI